MSDDDHASLTGSDVVNKNSVWVDHDIEMETSVFTDYKSYGMMDEIDPDNNFYAKFSHSCKYYSETDFNKCIDMQNKISLIHFNCRSLYANYDSIMHCLDQFNSPFNIIAMSETWLKSNKGIDFAIKGYEMFYTNRECKNGGGVALYIDKNIDCKVIENMSVAVEDVCESITVEICMGKQKNIIVSCIYRAPGANIEVFKEWMEKLFSLNTQKDLLICGDYNIDLLNAKKHKPTDDFIDTMFSMSLFPAITRPSRITLQSATLIDNIFTNIAYNNIVSGLLYNDTSDHLPVFVVYDLNHRLKKDKSDIKYIRIRTEETVNAFKADLLAQNWDSVLKENNVDIAYEKFLEIFKRMYDKNCPIKKVNRKNKCISSPWLTKGLINACKKKNYLYRQFIKYRTREAELKYKKYKNKLTTIMRTCRNDYYAKSIESKKNNLKDIWKVLNNIISRTNENFYPDYFIENNKSVTNMGEVVEGFNKFFVGVWPQLSEKIIESGSENYESLGELVERNPHTIFLKPTDENEITGIINNCNSKTSTDFNDFDMTIIKKVMAGIVKPSTYICNLSFQTGIFPSKMKTAKVIPLFKTGDKHLFTNYRSISLLSQFSKILEKLFVDRLNMFIEKHNLLSDCQCGFRKKRSTALALMDLVEEITNCIDKRKFVVGIFIDLKKAFDTIDHKIL